MKTTIGNGEIEVKQADLTHEHVDAIVNAANSRLQHGGGVAGAIVHCGGRVIQEESNKIGGCPVGEAVVTGAGKLPCRFVIHTVGPVNGEGDEERKLRNATRNSLLRAKELGIESVAFPAVSTGIYHYPVKDCARIMLGEARRFLDEEPGSVKRIVFCLFDAQTLEIWGPVLTI